MSLTPEEAQTFTTQFSSLEHGQQEIIDRLHELKDELDDVVAEIGRVEPHESRTRQPLTVRIHKLENDAYAAKLADEALRRQRDHVWSTSQKIGLFAIALFTAIESLVRLVFGVGS